MSNMDGKSCLLLEVIQIGCHYMNAIDRGKRFGEECAVKSAIKVYWQQRSGSGGDWWLQVTAQPQQTVDLVLKKEWYCYDSFLSSRTRIILSIIQCGYLVTVHI